jgi:outer membrane lipoprotein-sorting protein
MKRNAGFVLAVIGFFLSVFLSGCATVKEAAKGFAGVSTKVLDDYRPSALKESFALDVDRCYMKVKEVLDQKGKEAYIYAEDSRAKFIAVYLSAADTTPVGIYLTSSSGGDTLVEVSSPSTYAKEELAGRIFAGLGGLIKSGPQGEQNNVK